MNQGKWLPLKIKPTSLTRKVNVGGGRSLKIGVSPYDIPQAIRFSFDPGLRIASIDLKYILDDTDTKDVDLGDGIFVSVGKFRPRIHSVKFTLDGRESAESLDFRISKVLKVLSDAGADLETGNADIVEDAVSSAAPEFSSHR